MAKNIISYMRILCDNCYKEKLDNDDTWMNIVGSDFYICGICKRRIAYMYTPQEKDDWKIRMIFKHENDDEYRDICFYTDHVCYSDIPEERIPR